VIGAVGQGLVPTASAFLGGALAGSGAYTQQILGGLAPALAGGSMAAAKQAAGALGGFLFPQGPKINTQASPANEASYPNESDNTDGGDAATSEAILDETGAESQLRVNTETGDLYDPGL